MASVPTACLTASNCVSCVCVPRILPCSDGFCRVTCENTAAFRLTVNQGGREKRRFIQFVIGIMLMPVWAAHFSEWTLVWQKNGAAENFRKGRSFARRGREAGTSGSCGVWRKSEEGCGRGEFVNRCSQIKSVRDFFSLNLLLILVGKGLCLYLCKQNNGPTQNLQMDRRGGFPRVGNWPFRPS